MPGASNPLTGSEMHGTTQAMSFGRLLSLIAICVAWAVIWPGAATAKLVDVGAVLGPALEVYLWPAETVEDNKAKTDLIEEFRGPYIQLMETVEPGDTLRFSDGREVEVIRHLGHGANASVWQTKGNMAIRLPLFEQFAVLKHSFKAAHHSPEN